MARLAGHREDEFHKIYAANASACFFVSELKKGLDSCYAKVQGLLTRSLAQSGKT